MYFDDNTLNVVIGVKMKVYIYVFLVLIALSHLSPAAEVFSVEEAEKACLAGKPEQCGNLSKLELESGNLANAKDHGKKACDGGAMRGCVVLGIILKKSDKSEATRLFKKACDTNYAKGCINLALLKYEDGDKSEAKENMKKACDQGDALGCDRQGALENELGNKKEALSLYKKSCDQGEMLGCTDQGSMEYSNGNKDEAERLWQLACSNREKNACEKFDSYLDEKIRLYQFACDKGDLSGCYNTGLALTKKDNAFEEKNNILQIFQKACTGGEKRACDEIKRFLTKECINWNLKADRECYVDGPIERMSAGTSIIRRIRVHNESCDAKAKQAEKGLGCSNVGDFEAKGGNYLDAEKIYSEGCNKTNSTGCGGLVCMGYMKMNQKKEAEAKRLFKQACNFSETSPGTHDAKGYEGCTAIPIAPRNPKLVQQAIQAMTDKETECKKNWSRAWGPK
jgi:TPR repeat protein